MDVCGTSGKLHFHIKKVQTFQKISIALYTNSNTVQVLLLSRAVIL